MIWPMDTAHVQTQEKATGDFQGREIKGRLDVGVSVEFWAHCPCVTAADDGYDRWVGGPEVGLDRKRL